MLPLRIDQVELSLEITQNKLCVDSSDAANFVNAVNTTYLTAVALADGVANAVNAACLTVVARAAGVAHAVNAACFTVQSNLDYKHTVHCPQSHPLVEISSYRTTFDW